MLQYLPDANCPCCKQPLTNHGFEPDSKGAAPTAANYEGCLRRCETCHVGLSNTRGAPTVLFKEPLENIPPEAREGADEVLRLALNERNRESKRVKFGFHTSEDAVTWTVLTFLARSGQLNGAVAALAPALHMQDAEPPTLLLWGVPYPWTKAGEGVRKRLVDISDRLGEEPVSRSEPDVVLQMPSGAVVVIEVKHRSANDVKSSDYPGWKKGYLQNTDAFVDPDGARASGLYELVRNWRFAAELAGSNPFYLVNLGPEALRAPAQLPRLEKFEMSLRRSPAARFHSCAWHGLLSGIRVKPEWLVKFLMSRRLLEGVAA